MPKAGYTQISGAIQTEAIIRASRGENKTQIAKELGISRPTVARILRRSQLADVLEDCRKRAIQLNPLALDAVENRLRKNDGFVAVSILKGTGVLNSDHQVNIAIAVGADIPRPNRAVETNG